MIDFKLTSEEAVLLDGRCRPEVQALVDRAKLSLTLTELPEALATFVSEVVDEAHTKAA